MITIEDFEPSFDAVRFHLDIALNNAPSDREVAQVQQVAQQLFNLYTQLVVRMINQTKQGNSDLFLNKIRSGQSFPELVKEFQLVDCIVIVALDTLGNSIVGFVQKLFRDGQLSKRASGFYLQLARSYRKLLSSRIYSSKYDLIENAIDRQALDILNGIIALKEFDEAVEFVALLKNRKAFQADRAEQALIEGYRRSLMTGLKGMTRLLAYAYINFLLVCMMMGILIAMIFNQAYIILLVADVLAIRYFWRFGPKISALRSRIRRRVNEIARG
jgi:hypothetical protein